MKEQFIKSLFWWIEKFGVILSVLLFPFIALFKWLHEFYKTVMKNKKKCSDNEDRIDKVEKVLDNRLQNIDDQQSIIKNDLKWIKKDRKQD